MDLIRQKVRASLFQNGFLYKKGFVQLRSVNLENNKASSYKIFFTGLLGELKDIFKSDKLSDLLSLISLAILTTLQLLELDYRIILM